MMRTVTLITVAVLAAASAGAQQAPTAVAFTHVNVVPMDHEVVLLDQTVVVRGDRIAEVGPAPRVRVPVNAQLIDGRGKYLMPGVAEMHAHIPDGQAPPGYTERVLFLWLANGVTTIRGMLGATPHLLLREQAARGEIWSPTIVTSGPSLNGSSAPTPDVARRMVEEQHAALYDFIKIHPGLLRAAFDTLAATAQRLGMRFAGHVPVDVGLERALEAHYASIDHLDGFIEWLAGVRPGDGTNVGFFGLAVADRVDESRISEAARRTAEAGVWVVPTEVLLETVASGESPEQVAARPGTEYLPPSILQGWMTTLRGWRTQSPVEPQTAARFLAARRRLIRELQAAGAGILLGSDAPQVGNVPGFSLHRELRAYVAAGLTPYQALLTGTRNPAAFFGRPDEFGTVQPGRRADLVLLEGNPLRDIANFDRQAGVMVRGRWLPAEEIRRRLEALAAER
jgi:imidazolonepropionase-like amidohydrolase